MNDEVPFMNDEISNYAIDKNFGVDISGIRNENKKLKKIVFELEREKNGVSKKCK